MNEQHREILRMLAEGRITAGEAEQLIDALEREQPASKPRPKYLRVVVKWEDEFGDGPGRVNVRVPLQLLRAGVRLTSLVPPQALAKANAELDRSGIPIDLARLKPEHLEELVEHLDDLTVDVDETDAKVRVFCE